MKEYIIQSRIKNNLLYKEVFNNFKSLKKASQVIGIPETEMCLFINMKRSAYKLNKNRTAFQERESVRKICFFFNKTPEQLFPENQLYNRAKKTIINHEVSQQELKCIDLINPNEKIYFLEDIESKKQLRKLTDEALGKIPEREAKIIKLRFGLEGTAYNLREIGEIMGISDQRVRQLESRALLRLKHPKNSTVLKPFFEES